MVLLLLISRGHPPTAGENHTLPKFRHLEFTPLGGLCAWQRLQGWSGTLVDDVRHRNWSMWTADFKHVRMYRRILPSLSDIHSFPRGVKH